MATERPLDAGIVGAALRLFPPRVGAAILEDVAFRGRVPRDVEAVVRLERTGAEFSRSTLFRIVRQVLIGSSPGVDVKGRDGTVWRVTHDTGRGITVSREGVADWFPEFAVLAPDADTRMKWFELQTVTCSIGEERTRRWRKVLADRPLEDEEVDELLDEFCLTPMHYVTEIRNRLRMRKVSATDLVPSDHRYFGRLAGEPAAETELRQFVSGVLRSHLDELVRWNPCEGLRTAFVLSSHQMIAEVVDLAAVPRTEVSRVFEWLRDSGDRISQIGAIECGLRHLDSFPEIEPCLAAMTREMSADDPEDIGGRLKLLSGLVVLVEGEVIRRGLARRRPPFWRRLSSIAHAALIEREVLNAKLEVSGFADWALKSGWGLYYMQSLVDLRQEPRWFPDFISPEQLKAELLGRIAFAAERYRDNIPDGELRSLLWGERAAIEAQTVAPYALLPGPLEGGVESVIKSPAELESSIRTNLEAGELTSESFVGLVNSALICRTNAQLSELAAQGLSRVGYQLRKSSTGEAPSLLLNGLAMVSAVTRSKVLAKEVRNLWRVAGRRDSGGLLPGEAVRVALVTAAASEELSAWSDVVGDWLTELGFFDMTREEAIALQGELYALLQVEPLLWETCGRAEAALSAFLKTCSDHAEEKE